MGMKKTITICLILALLLISGCAKEGTQAGDVIGSELLFEGDVNDAIPEQQAQKQEIQTGQRSEWEIFREYVTDEYAISTEYFDKHFILDSVEEDVSIRSDRYDPAKREFPTVLEGATLVRYHLKLNDEAGNEYIAREHIEGVYLKDGEVIDVKNRWLEGIDMSLLEHKSYDSLGPTSELAVKKDKQEAIKAAKWIVECTRKDNFDTWEARENLKIKWIDGKIVWAWESKGNACLVNAGIEENEVEVMVV